MDYYQEFKYEVNPIQIVQIIDNGVVLCAIIQYQYPAYLVIQGDAQRVPDTVVKKSFMDIKAGRKSVYYVPLS